MGVVQEIGDGFDPCDGNDSGNDRDMYNDENNIFTNSSYLSNHIIFNDYLPEEWMRIDLTKVKWWRLEVYDYD